MFDELTSELSRFGVEADVVMVGGAWMLWHEQRVSTFDVDSGRRFETDLGDVVARVGARHGIRRDWLNDAAAAFWPSGASYDDCEVVYEQGGLLVRAPDPEVIFVMKLYRADPQDREDLVSLGQLSVSWVGLGAWAGPGVRGLPGTGTRVVGAAVAVASGGACCLGRVWVARRGAAGDRVWLLPVLRGSVGGIGSGLKGPGPALGAGPFSGP